MFIYFVRHGQTDWNLNGQFQGQTDIPLNDNGIAQAQQAHEILSKVHFAAAYASPLGRAMRTAEIITTGSGLIVTPEPLLKEISFGHEEGAKAMVAKHPEHPLYNFLFHPERYAAPEGGESLYQVAARVLQFIDLTMQRHADLPSDAKILAACHGGIIMTLMVLCRNQSFSQLRKNKPHKNCSVTVVEANAQRYALRAPALDILGGEELPDFEPELHEIQGHKGSALSEVKAVLNPDAVHSSLDSVRGKPSSQIKL